MKEKPISSNCDQGDLLVSVLYGEVTERERRDFELHLKQCAGCRAEFAAFAQVRDSIGEWRDEALTGFVPSPAAMAAPRVKKSAVVALRQFLDLSPLWLKGAAGFAAVVFCVLATLAVLRMPAADPVTQIANSNSGAIYTKEEAERMVQEALAKQQREQPIIPVVKTDSPSPKRPNLARSEPKARRPFSRAEREQLAADLRLLSTDDEIDLEPLDDRSNR